MLSTGGISDAGISDALDPSGTPTIISVAVTDNIEVSDAISINFKYESVSNSILITDHVTVRTPIIVNVSDSLLINDVITTNNASVSDTITITENIKHQGPILVHVSDLLRPTDSVVLTGNSLTVHVSDSIEIIDSVGRSYVESVSDTITITDLVERLNAPVDQITITDHISFELSHGVRDSLTITDSAVANIVRATIALSDTIQIRQHVTVVRLVPKTIGSVSYSVPVISDGTTTFRQDLSYTPESNSPTPLSCNAPFIIPATTITLTWPYTTPTNTLVLRAPEFNNIDKKHQRKIIRTSRGGTLRVFRDSQWPEYARLNYTVRILKESLAQDLLTFFRQSLGTEIGLLDYENRQWVGFITTPQSAIEFQLSRGIRVVQFEFEGSLVGGSIA